MGYTSEQKMETRGWTRKCYQGSHQDCNNHHNNCLCPCHQGKDMKVKRKNKKINVTLTTHWICKFCQILNHNTRTKCLGCDVIRADSEANEKQANIIRNYWHDEKP